MTFDLFRVIYYYILIIREFRAIFNIGSACGAHLVFKDLNISKKISVPTINYFINKEYLPLILKHIDNKLNKSHNPYTCL